MFVMPFPKANTQELQSRLTWHGRMGTCYADNGLLLHILGEPNRLSLCDKVTVGWIFATPHGIAEIRDYWWNPHVEWSLSGENRDSVEDLSAALIALGASVEGWEFLTQVQ